VLSCLQFREKCSFSDAQVFTVKWLDDEGDPCTISSQVLQLALSVKACCVPVHILLSSCRVDTTQHVIFNNTVQEIKYRSDHFSDDSKNHKTNKFHIPDTVSP